MLFALETTTRKVIGQAVGTVMERYQLDEDRALMYLAQVSQHSNVKLRDVAAELVQQAHEKTLRPRAGSSADGGHGQPPQ